MTYLKTIECKVCGVKGKVKKISTHENFDGYVCDNCNWYFNRGKKKNKDKEASSK